MYMYTPLKKKKKLSVASELLKTEVFKHIYDRASSCKFGRLFWLSFGCSFIPEAT